ncbi:SrtB family sortase [Peptoanaerobacter stomatis]|uniref:SrtB family sortase n=1 Tax=Peptoanaerobacter stomatis TaxID=796937 RepID=V9HLD4_9FIRM|nr:class B sortase [Peptoanaerobacter stomatis]EHL18175.1 SrtB family sortase [Peptoanaerobacter stomatis]
MKQTTFKIINIILICVFVISGVLLLTYRISLYMSKKQFDNLSNMHRQVSDVQIQKKSEKKEITQKERLKVFFDNLQNKNSDIAAWIKLDGANIDYPVMYTPDDPQFYLRKNIDKNYALSGTPFLDHRTKIDNSQKTSLYIVYAHNMGDGTMFTNLHNYIDENNLKNANPVLLEMPDALKKYKLFAAVMLKEYTRTADIFYNTTSIKSEEEFNKYINFLKTNATAISDDISPKYGDDILVMSTCSYHVKSGRLALVAISTQDNDN